MSYRVRLLLVLAAVVALGTLSQLVRVGRDGLFDPEGAASIFYVMGWAIGWLAVFPAARPWVVTGIVLAVTCLLEVAQLWHPPFLEALRATLPGRLLLGTTFSPRDFPAYFVGAAATLVVTRVLRDRPAR